MEKKARGATSKPDPIHTQPLAVRKAARALLKARLDHKAKRRSAAP